MEAAGSSETSITTSQTEARQSTEDRSLNAYCRHDLLTVSGSCPRQQPRVTWTELGTYEHDDAEYATYSWP